MNATVDETIDRVEQLYTTLTGRPPQEPRHRAPIPPEADPVVHVQEQLGRMVALAERLVPQPAVPAWVPRAVAWMHDSDLVLAVDLPGVLARDLGIRVEPRAIVVHGQRRPPWAHPPRSLGACEPPLGAFSRSFPVAARVAPDQVGARLDDGVLTIRVHSGTRAEPSKIQITS